MLYDEADIFYPYTNQSDLRFNVSHGKMPLNASDNWCHG